MIRIKQGEAMMEPFAVGHADELRSRPKGTVVEKPAPIRRVSPQDGGHWFFGYFDKCPWDESGQLLLGLRTEFMDRQPRPSDKVGIYLLDTTQGDAPRKLADSSAFCWQQANMLQWLPGGNGREIIFNDRAESGFISRILDIDTLEERRVDHPIYCLNPNGRQAISVNFSRLDTQRPGYGYPGIPDPWEQVNDPEDDGIRLVDLQANTSRLIISNADLMEQFPAPEYEGRKSWFNHLLCSPSGDRFFFLQRCLNPDPSRTKRFTRLFTANTDGSDIYLLNADEMTSHLTWLDDTTVMAYAGRFGVGWHYYLLRDKSQDYELIAPELFDSDGHCSPDASGRWMLTDTYPREDNCRELIVYDRRECIRYNLGRFFAPPKLAAPLRCDLHPNWSRDFRQVCFDSLHEGFRGIYIADVEDITHAQ
jgi:hypothetical protein